MHAPRFSVRSVLALGGLLAGCHVGDVPDGPPPPLGRVAAELGAPPADTVWLRERDLDGPRCALRVDPGWGGGWGSWAVPGDATQATLFVAFAEGELSTSDTFRVEVEGTGCARGVHGARPSWGTGVGVVTERGAAHVVGALAADLEPFGGMFARAGRRFRVLGTFHLSL